MRQETKSALIIVICVLVFVTLIIGAMTIYTLGVKDGYNANNQLTDSSKAYLHGKILDLPEELTAQKEGDLHYKIIGDTIHMGFSNSYKVFRVIPFGNDVWLSYISNGDTLNVKPVSKILNKADLSITFK